MYLIIFPIITLLAVIICIHLSNKKKRQAYQKEVDVQEHTKTTPSPAAIEPIDTINEEETEDDISIARYSIDSHGIPIELTIKKSKLMVIDHKDHQKSSSPLQPFPIEWINGYTSPSGGYVNFSRYEVRGLNSKTNRKNRFICEAISEEEAIKIAQCKKSLSSPFEVSIIPHLKPPDYQLSYAEELGITVPDDACYYDVRALIARVRNHDEGIPDKQTVIDACNNNLMFSRFAGKQELQEKQINRSLE